MSNITLEISLGKGNFGGVYQGFAYGLFYPGSETKVAIKTVNNTFDPAQFDSLFCELKVLANLDNHPNLVNMLASCTSQIGNGKLWLLLEFCPHGDLKNFLIKHRKEFIESIKKKIAIKGLHHKLFLQWSHNIAKGRDLSTILKLGMITIFP